METASKENTPVCKVPTGVYFTKEQERILRLYAKAKGTKTSALVRGIISEWIDNGGITEKDLIALILEQAKRDWQIQELQNIQEPNKAVAYCDFIKSINTSFKRLPIDVRGYLMKELRKDETNK